MGKFGGSNESSKRKHDKSPASWKWEKSRFGQQDSRALHVATPGQHGSHRKAAAQPIGILALEAKFSTGPRLSDKIYSQ
jgi:hypothetical protein